MCPKGGCSCLCMLLSVVDRGSWLLSYMASGQIFVVMKILNSGAVSLLFMFLNVCHETYHIYNLVSLIVLDALPMTWN